MPRSQVLIASAVIASALAIAAPAQATSFTGNGSSSIIAGTGAFYDSAIPAGSFTDTIDFTVPSAGTADVNIIYFKLISGITSLAATFNGAAITFTPLGGNIFAGGTSAPVVSGPQVLKITGVSGGSGSYSGNVIFSAVPEAATWLMMMAGIGFTGFAMRRRKLPTTVNYAF